MAESGDAGRLSLEMEPPERRNRDNFIPHSAFQVGRQRRLRLFFGHCRVCLRLGGHFPASVTRPFSSFSPLPRPLCSLCLAGAASRAPQMAGIEPYEWLIRY
jgi:hypothetical protein